MVHDVEKMGEVVVEKRVVEGVVVVVGDIVDKVEKVAENKVVVKGKVVVEDKVVEERVVEERVVEEGVVEVRFGDVFYIRHNRLSSVLLHVFPTLFPWTKRC